MLAKKYSSPASLACFLVWSICVFRVYSGSHLSGIRRQIVIYFSRHTGSLLEKTAERQRDSGTNRCQRNSVKNYMSEKVRRVGRLPARHSGTPPMLVCAGAGSWYSGVVGSVRARKGSTSESLAQETSVITTTESAETRIIDFFMTGTVVDAAGQFNRRTP